MQAVRRQRHGVALPSASGRGVGLAHYIRQGLKYTLDATMNGMPLDSLYAGPMSIPAGTKFDQVGVRFGNLPGVNARLGLYASDSRTSGPGALVLDFGTLAGAANSDVTMAIDLSIEEAGIYWLALQEEGGVIASFNTPTQRGGGLLRGAASYLMAAGYLVGGQAGGSLADPFPPAATLTGSGYTIYMRVAEAPPPRRRLKRDQSIGTPMGRPGENSMWLGQLEPASPTPTMAVVADTIYALPILIQESADYGGIEFPATIIGAGTAYVGLYDANADGYPRELLFGSAAIPLNAAGTKVTACNFHLPAGLYWLALQTDNAGANIIHSRFPDGFLGFAATLDGQFPHLGLNSASVSAGMPASFPSGAGSSRVALDLGLNVRQALPLFSPYVVGQGLPRRGFVNVSMPTAHHLYHEGWYVGPCSYQWQPLSAKYAHNDKASAVRFVLDRETTFDQVWMDVFSVTGVGYNIEMGVYEETGWFFPGRLLVATGPQARANQAGVQTFSLDFTLSPGAYWLAVATQLAGATAVDLEGVVVLAYRHGWFGDGMPVAHQSQNIGTLPDPWTGTGAGIATAMVGMRVKHYGAA